MLLGITAAFKTKHRFFVFMLFSYRRWKDTLIDDQDPQGSIRKCEEKIV